jgi:hypothetical protein
MTRSASRGPTKKIRPVANFLSPFARSWTTLLGTSNAHILKTLYSFDFMVAGVMSGIEEQESRGQQCVATDDPRLKGN